MDQPVSEEEKDMFYRIADSWYQWLSDHGFGFFRLFLDPQFRAVAAIIFSFLIVILFGKRTIRLLMKMKIGDNPEFYNADLNELAKDKANTPTMGGILIVAAILLPTLILADLANFYVKMALICLIWLAVLGGFDDWLKLTSARRKEGGREGLYSWEKLVFQLGLAVVLGLFIHYHGQNADPSDQTLRTMAFSLNLPFVKTWVHEQGMGYVANPDLIQLGAFAFVVLTVLVIVGSSNAVNLTDGMDGLAGGIVGIVGFAFVILALLAGDEHNAEKMLVPYIAESGELAVVCGAIAGACLGFLWFNCHPAQVFMGDTGSLPLGGLLGYVAVVTRQEILLLIIGGIFVIEALSVMAQVGFFKISGGRRIFKCAPIHHHFQLSGWSEQQVVVRFWLVSALLAAVALASLKIR